MQIQQTAGDQVNVVIDHLASKLAVPATQLWAVLVRQPRISLMVHGMECLVAAGVCLPCAVKAWQCYTAWNEAQYEWEQSGYKAKRPRHEFAWVPWVILAMVSGIFVLAALCCSFGDLSDVLNPQNWALHEIIGAIK